MNRFTVHSLSKDHVLIRTFTMCISSTVRVNCFISLSHRISQHNLLKHDRLHLGTCPCMRTMARKTHLKTILCSQNRLSLGSIKLKYIRLETNLCIPGNISKVCNVVWLLVWNGICWQCKKKQTG